MSLTVEDFPQAIADELLGGALHEIYVEQVRLIYPHGTTLHCESCGHTLPVTVEQLAHAMESCWPKHCRGDMRIGDHSEEASQ